MQIYNYRSAYSLLMSLL